MQIKTTARYHYTPTRIDEKARIPNASEDAEQHSPPPLQVGRQNKYSHLEKSLADLYIVKPELTLPLITILLYLASASIIEILTAQRMLRLPVML